MRGLDEPRGSQLGTIVQCLETFFVCHTGGALLGLAGICRQRPGLQLNILQYMGQSPTTVSDPDRRSRELRLSDPGFGGPPGLPHLC